MFAHLLPMAAIATGAELSSCYKRLLGSQSLTYLLPHPLQEKFAHPCLKEGLLKSFLFLLLFSISTGSLDEVCRILEGVE